MFRPNMPDNKNNINPGPLSLQICNNSTFIQGRMGSKTYQRFKKLLGYLPEDSYWMVKNSASKAGKNEAWKKDWDGHVSTVCWNKKFCHCHVKKNGLHFPTGLMSLAVSFFRENNIPFNVTDMRDKIEKGDIYTISDEFESRDYQVDIIDKIVGIDGGKGIDRGIIKCATGGGKCPIACGIIAGIGVTPTIFYVPSIDLLKQTKDEIIRFVRHNGIPVEVGMVGGGKKELKDITVMTIQTAVRALGGLYVKYDDEDISKDETDIDDIKEDIKDLIKSCRLMISDECQHWSAETCQIISDASVSAQYKYAMSATPHRDKGDDILIDGCFGRSIANINASFLIKKGYLVKPTIYFAKISNMRGFKKASYPNVYRQAIVENEFRNNKIVQMATRFRDSERKILILVKQIAHGKLLESLIPESIFLYGSTSKKKRQKHLDLMRENKPRITIASVIFDEGINCRPLDTLILAGSGKSPTRALQRIGRILRPYEGKENAIVVDFMDTCKYMQAHSKKRASIYKTEEEFDIIGD